MQLIWSIVTDYGDSAVTLPLALLTLIFLITAGQRRLALGWLTAIGLCGAVIAALKLVFGACVLGNIISPSGHTAMSAVVYGSLALLVGATLSSGRRRAAVYAGAAILVCSIALSRVALHDHDVAEVMLGLILGGAAAAGFHAVLRSVPDLTLSVGWLVLAAFVIVMVMHGTHWTVEPALRCRE